MADPHAATRELLEERPEMASALESILTADETGAWGFDDVDVDSGTFGELVSRGIVERDGDEYRVADRDAVRAALTGDAQGSTGAGGGGFGAGGRIGGTLGRTIRGWRRAVHRDLLVGLAGSFLLLLAFRLVTFASVFRENRVVLPGNDPYHYLYWVEQLSEADPDPLAFDAIADVLGARAVGEPLVHTIGWWATELVGGEAAAVVAWIPIVATVLVGAGVALVAFWTTNDERVTVASVVVLALLPGHALYSGIGFFDHTAIDYVWLTASIVGVTWLAKDHETRDPDARIGHLTSPATWAVVGALGVVFAAMALSWNGSPILLVGLAVYATLRATSDMRAGWNPLVAAAPVASALGVGFLLAYWLHSRAGWQEPLVVYAPLLVAVGVVLVSLAAAALQRVNAHPGVHLAVSAASVVPLWVGLRRVAPDVASRLTDRATRALLGREGISETRGLVDADYAVFFGPVDHFGWFLFLALPVLGWVGWRCVRTHEPRWLVVVSYASALLAFALVQIRFAGEATGMVAVLSGLGLVRLLAVIDVAAPPTPFGDRSTRTRIDLWPEGLSGRDVGYAAAGVMLVASLSVFMVPAVMDNVAATDEEADAIEWIDAHAAEADGPEYVLTEWGRNRMFNYAVSGESNTYGYALRTYEPFVRDQNPDSYADEFGGRVGYVVISELDADAPETSGYVQLFEHHGSATPAANGSGRLRLAYVTADDSIKVFRPVAGATVTGEAEPGTTVTVRATVTAAGEEFAYERRATADQNGTFAVVVAYPGTYETEGASSDSATVEVADTAVRSGETVTVGS